MPIATRLTNTGTLLVNGIFDENTFSPSLIADALVIGGGGAGGHLGGGGAGGHRYFVDQSLVSNTNYTVTVGAGGLASAGATGNPGSNSVFDTYTSAGGGGGAGESALPTAGGSGGGGGGVAGTSRPGAAGNTPSTSPSQGNAGGNGNDNGAGTAFAGGGGGGAGGTGNNASGATTAGNGGLGTPNSITGTSVTRAAGGGGGAYQFGSTATAGTGGSSIGGNGGRNGLNATSGSVNTGSGGGGNGYTSAGNLQGSSGAGGSGVVIIKYPNIFTISNSGGGLTFTTDSSSVPGYNITTFTAGTGQISFIAPPKFRTTSTTVYAGELDEVTISGGAVAKREINTGVLQVKNIFDEFTGAPIVDSSLTLWLDAGQPTSYSGSGSTWTDLSSSVNNATLTNSPTFSSATNGGIFTFNGTTNYISLANPQASAQTPLTGYGFTGASNSTFTLEIWIKTSQVAGSVSYNAPGLISRDSGDIYSNLTLYDGYVYFTHYDGAWQSNLKSTTMVSNNVWHQVVYVNNSNDTGSIYIDGNVEVTGSSSVVPGNYFAPNNIGWGYSGQYFSGSVGSVKFYSRVLSSDEITTNFNALRNRYGI